MAFSFGFSGDDIEQDPNDATNLPQHSHTVADAGNESPPIGAQTHDMNELLSTLPSKLSYNFLSISSPLSHTARLPRRELFDVRLQLMSEDDGTSSTPLAGLQTSDLTTNVYEGGYKTWECSLDLVKYLLDRGPRKDLDDLVRVDHVIEMGAGTALPTLLLWQYAIKNGLRMHFTVMDYNIDVLRLVTLPNLLLAWAATLSSDHELFVGEEGNPLADESVESGDLDITPHLLATFKSFLQIQGLTLTLLSGSWTPVPHLLSLVPSIPDMNTFILASETIYSPSSLTAFTSAMIGLMKRVKSGKAVVAAKRVYFGVGGSVDGFREEVACQGAVGYEMEFEGLESDGVRRCLVEVQMC